MDTSVHMNEMTHEPYSVLMSVYYKEKPQFLRQSVLSIAHQSVPTDDFVLVCDGPLTPELDQVLAEMQALLGDILHIVRLPVNGGLGRALNEGLQHCRHGLIARMDSDDISRPDRCERELAVFARMDVDIVSGAVEEFTTDPRQVDVLRVPPEHHSDILEFAKRRNPFYHPCVMYRKASVLAVGGYQEFYLLEDYHLWLRMLLQGARGYNLPQPLLWMRAGSDMYRRRAGWKYAASQRRLFRFMHAAGMISAGECFCSGALRTLSSLAPNWLRERMFKLFLRKTRTCSK